MKRSISIESRAGLTFGELAEFIDAGRAAGVDSAAPVIGRVNVRGFRLRLLTVNLFGSALCVGPATAEDVRR